MNSARYFPVFTPKDRRLQSVEAVAIELCASRAFVRLCVASGCPVADNLLSAAGLLQWLFDNYHTIRAAAGLSPLAPIDGVSAGARQRLRMANALFTVFDFSESRTVSLEEKSELRQWQRRLERAVDRC